MTSVLDTNVLIDALRQRGPAWKLIRSCREVGTVHASEVTRVEVLSGMRSEEKAATLQLFELISWHPVDEHVATIAGRLGHHWIPKNRGIDLPDYVVAATAIRLRADLKTLNVKHFPMFENLTPPY